jgi:hypothetical protein
MCGARESRGKTARPVPAKVIAPEITGYFPRKRLFRLLDDARKRPVIWISAPPGSGKTTLVSSYIDARWLPRLWYQVDERDADIATFFYYLGLAAQRAAPRKRKPLTLLTPEYLSGLPVFTRRFFDELFARLPAPSVVVFDNYQKIPLESMLHDVTRDAVACLPRNVNLFLVSRSAPPPAFAPLSANRLSSVIGWEEMRLTGEETRGITRRHGRRSFRGEEIRRLEKSVDGWVAGLVLMLEKAAAEGVVPEGKEARTPEEIVDYFGGEVFGQVDPETRTFLLGSSFLPRMTAEMAQRLTGYARAGEILSALCRNNWFTQAHGRDEPVYQYHALFREFLLSRAGAALPAAEIQRLQRTTADLLTEKGQVEDAVLLLRESGDREELLRVVLSQASSLVAQGRFRTLEEWLRALPENTLDDVPWTRYWMGVSRMPFHPEESGPLFESAFHEFRKQSDPAGVFLAWSGVVDSIFFSHNDLSRLDPWIEILDRMVTEWGGLPPGPIEARVTSAMIKALAFRQPAHPSAETWANRCASVARSIDDVNTKVENLVGLAIYRIYTGRLSMAETVFDELDGLIRRRGVSPLSVMAATRAKAIHALMMCEHHRCLELVSEGLAQAVSVGIHLFDFSLMCEGVHAFMHLGDMAAAKKGLGEVAIRLHTAKPWEMNYYHYLAGWDAFHDREFAQAGHYSELAIKGAEDLGGRLVLAVVYLQT